MSLVLHYIDTTSGDMEVMESFTDFIPVLETSGQDLSKSLFAALHGIGLNISDCRGQGYDSCANMKGQKQVYRHASSK